MPDSWLGMCPRLLLTEIFSYECAIVVGRALLRDVSVAVHLVCGLGPIVDGRSHACGCRSRLNALEVE